MTESVTTGPVVCSSDVRTRIIAWLLGSLVGALLVAPASARDPEPVPVSRPSTGLLDVLTEQGMGAGHSLFGVGLDVTPLRPALTPIPEAPTRLTLTDPGTAISLDLRLRWPTLPSTDRAGVSLPQPYVTLGPALFVIDPVDALVASSAGGDVSLSLGVRAGVGLTWQLDRNALLFGEYRLTRGADDRSVVPGGGGGSGAGAGYDLLYGVRLRF